MRPSRPAPHFSILSNSNWSRALSQKRGSKRHGRFKVPFSPTTVHSECFLVDPTELCRAEIELEIIFPLLIWIANAPTFEDRGPMRLAWE